MGLSAKQIKQGLDAVAALEPGIARALEIAGYPEPRIRPTGYKTLLRTIVGQQVSVAAAAHSGNPDSHSQPTMTTSPTRKVNTAPRFRHAARLRPLPPEAGLCPIAMRTGERGRAGPRKPARRR